MTYIITEPCEAVCNTACVEVCPTHCLYFGDLDDPESEVSLILKKRKFKTLIPEAGTDPQLYFLT